jgi:hypothetical protein
MLHKRTFELLALLSFFAGTVSADCEDATLDCGQYCEIDVAWDSGEGAYEGEEWTGFDGGCQGGDYFVQAVKYSLQVNTFRIAGDDVGDGDYIMFTGDLSGGHPFFVGASTDQEVITLAGWLILYYDTNENEQYDQGTDESLDSAIIKTK